MMEIDGLNKAVADPGFTRRLERETIVSAIFSHEYENKNKK